MTKKELLENKVFKDMPMDTELVFGIDDDIDHFQPLLFEQLTFEMCPTTWLENPTRENELELLVPKMKCFLKINAIPVPETINLF